MRQLRTAYEEPFSFPIGTFTFSEGERAETARADSYAGLDIEERNSALAFVFARRPSNNSIASTVERGLRTFRSTQMRFSSSGGSRSSSLRVPERLISIVGKTRLSTRRRSRLI